MPPSQVLPEGADPNDFIVSVVLSMNIRGLTGGPWPDCSAWSSEKFPLLNCTIENLFFEDTSTVPILPNRSSSVFPLELERSENDLLYSILPAVAAILVLLAFACCVSCLLPRDGQVWRSTKNGDTVVGRLSLIIH